MAPDPAAALSALLRSASIQDHDEILKAANAAIKANRTDFASHHTRVVALLKLDRFDDALRSIEEGGTKLNGLCVLEKAYALYKTGKLDDATAVLQAAGLSERSFSHVAAQVAYRAERFDEARTVYQRLLDTDPAGEENDLNINLRAACAQSAWHGFAPVEKEQTLQDSDGFEVYYNAACVSIARGSLDLAAQLLQRALRLCDASDDLSAEDKAAEMRPILAQQAYIWAKMGKLTEAQDLYKSLQPTSDDDADFSVITRNNQLTLGNNPENPFIFQREFQESKKAEDAAKLFKYQTNILHRNSLVVDLQAFKPDGVVRRTEKLLAQAQHPTIAADVSVFSVLNAAASAPGVTGKPLVKKLLDLSKKRPLDVGLVLTVIQLQLRGEHAGAALNTLESFFHRLEESEELEAHDVRFSPGLIALAVALMRSQGRESTAKSELVKAATHWKDRAVGTASSLLEEAGVELMRSSQAQDLQLAGASFQKLLDERQGSVIAAAGVVASLAPSDPARVQQYLADLPPVETLIAGVDVDALVGAGVATVAKPAAPVSAKRSAPEEPATRATKRRRKPRLPKNYEPGKAPDPERWLPLRDRSSYRPKGKKGKKKAGESTQGGIVKEEETLELVGGGGVKVEKAPASKKKKKGKK